MCPGAPAALRDATVERLAAPPPLGRSGYTVRVSFEHVHRFASTAALTQTLSARIGSALQDGLGRGRGASLVMPGGRTPRALFEVLSRAELDWPNVWVTLTDERWVEPGSSASNEHLVREHLLRNAAHAANFVGLKNSAPNPAAGAHASWAALADLPRPFDYVVLGMGEDGHTASLMPGSPGLVTALDLSQPPGCVPMQGPSAPHARLSLNLRALLDARRIAILITGASKWSVYQRAREAGPAEAMPVRALLHQQAVPVAVYWAPS